MKTNEFLRLLQKNGIRLTLKKHGGNHDVYLYEAKNEIVIIPRHPAEEIKPGLLNKLLKQVGLK